MNETSTENLAAMFMPECSIVSHILVIIKPEYYDYYTEIVVLIKRLNYRMHQLDIKRIENEKARALLR